MCFDKIFFLVQMIYSVKEKRIIKKNSDIQKTVGALFVFFPSLENSKQ